MLHETKTQNATFQPIDKHILTFSVYVSK